MLALRGLRRRPHFVTTVHGLNSPSLYSSVMLRGERVIIVSHSVRDYVLRHYPWVDQSRLRVIPRGVDPAEFPYGYGPDETWINAFMAQYPALAGAPLLTLPGRGTRLKGHAEAIELVAGLKARGIDVRLLLLGIVEPDREAYVAEMRALAERLGVAAQVVFSPPRSDVRDVYAISALVLQLSTYPESFGRTVLEALSLCRPVLGYAHGGVGDLLAELYPAGRIAPGDREKLVERAAELLRLAPPIPPLQHYTLEAMQQATLAVYAELAGTTQ
jgi:glycosyltransferase involved in cell wall biosynthesis